MLGKKSHHWSKPDLTYSVSLVVATAENLCLVKSWNRLIENFIDSYDIDLLQDCVLLIREENF